MALRLLELLELGEDPAIVIGVLELLDGVLGPGCPQVRARVVLALIRVFRVTRQCVDPDRLADDLHLFPRKSQRLPTSSGLAHAPTPR